MFVDIKEKIAVTQAYIKHRTDKEVDINLNQFRDMGNIMQLEAAYQIALKWFQENNGKIELINK